jgi:hypothetical protein
VAGGIGGFLELPLFSVNITQLNNVDQQCEKTTSSPGIIVGNFINIVPTVDMEVEVLAQLDIDEVDYHQSTQSVLVSTQYPIEQSSLSPKLPISS